MSGNVPAIYTARGPSQRLGWMGRLAALAVGLGCLSVLIVAVRIKPSPKGIGTHEEMGFASCQFERRTGLPCPTCGMTTSFAHFVRGQWAGSFYIQPAGWMLALATAMCFWGGCYIAWTGRPVYRLFNFYPSGYYVGLVFVVVSAAWAWKIWIHLNGRDGWG